MILQTGLRTDMPRGFSPAILKQRLSNLARMDVFCEKTAKMRFSPQLLAFDPIDATGAGDAFNAGFIYGLYHNYGIRTCIAMGNRMGGACVSKVGCLSGYLTEEQLLREFQASNPSR